MLSLLVFLKHHRWTSCKTASLKSISILARTYFPDSCLMPPDCSKAAAAATGDEPKKRELKERDVWNDDKEQIVNEVLTYILMEYH